MTDSTFIQILLILQVFTIGVLITIAVRHLRAHYWPGPPEEVPPSVVPEYQLPPIFKEHLMQSAWTQFQASVKNSSTQLQHDLDSSGEQVNNLVIKLATDIVEDELKRYRVQLMDLHKQAESDMGGIRTEIAGYQADLKAKMAQEIGAEKLRLIKQLDSKLSDAVSSFLVETLGHNIDLGSQNAYLIALLEEHKADFIKEVAGEAYTAK